MNVFLEEIKEQPVALERTASWLSAASGEELLRQIRELWMKGCCDRIILTGMGSSYFLSVAGEVLFASVGIPAFAVNAGELLHFHRSRLTGRTLLVVLSQSGESYEVVELLKRLHRQQGRPLVVGITNESDSRLGRLADYVLLSQAGREEMTSTKTFVASYWVLWQLVEAFKGEHPASEVCRELAAEVKRLLDESASLVSRATAFLRGHSFVHTIGRGLEWAAAAQTALMLMEAVKLPSSALLGGEFRHGPLEMVNEGTVVVIYVHSQSGVYAPSVKLAQDVLRFGGKVLWVSDEALDESDGHLLNVTVACRRADLFVIPSIVPLQLVVNALAEAAGLRPGYFLHGAKVTLKE